MNRPYVIPVLSFVEPRCRSAGVRATYALCRAINRLGERAVVYVNDDGNAGAAGDLLTPDWSTLHPLERRRVIAVATDGVPLTIAGRSVKWWLGSPTSKPWGPDGPGKIIPAAPGDYSWSQIWDLELRRLWLKDVYDTDIFRPRHPPARRRGAVVWPGKHGDLSEADCARCPTDAIFLSNQWPWKREDLAELFCRSELLISFDSFSGMNVEASFCGCPVLILAANGGLDGEPNVVTKERLLAHPFIRPVGYAWSEEELPAARAAVVGAYDDFLAWAKTAEGDVARFVEETQRRFQ